MFIWVRVGESVLKHKLGVAVVVVWRAEVLEAMRMGLGDKRGLQPGEEAPWGNKTLGSITGERLHTCLTTR